MKDYRTIYEISWTDNYGSGMDTAHTSADAEKIACDLVDRGVRRVVVSGYDVGTMETVSLLQFINGIRTYIIRNSKLINA